MQKEILLWIAVFAAQTLAIVLGCLSYRIIKDLLDE